MKRQSLSFLILTSLLLSAPTLGKQRSITVGKPLPTISATAASGRWLERASLTSDTYGKSRGTSPANSQEAKIVLYTPTLSEEFFQLALAVDALIAKHPEQTWSFVQVRDPKGAQYGGYTADELQTRLSAIKALAEKHGIQHLSFLVSAPPAHPGDTTITLAHTKPATPDAERSLVSWTAQVKSADLNKTTIARLIGELSVTIGK